MERRSNLEEQAGKINVDVSGNTTAVGFGRGGTPKDVRYMKVNISGNTDGAGFGRGGTPKDVRYVDVNTSNYGKSADKPANISGSTDGAGFGRGGTPKDVRYRIVIRGDTKEARGNLSNDISRNR